MKIKLSSARVYLIILPMLLAGSAAVQAADETVTGNLTVTGKISGSGNDGVLFGGTFGSGVIPATGNGTRMMWYPKKGAFRVGTVIGDYWDDDNIGQYSVAMGYNSVAYGSNSAALSGGVVLGANSTAISAGNVEGGNNSVAMSGGWVDGDYGTTMSGGQGTGSYFTAMSGGSVDGQYSTAMGDGQVFADYGTAMSGGIAEGVYSVAAGEGTFAGAAYSFAIGRYGDAQGNIDEWVNSDPLFVIGNGNSTSARNALTVLKNGKVSIFGTNPSTAEIVLDPTTSPPEIKVNGKPVVLASTSGNVGLGTSSPSEKLDLYGASSGGGNVSMRLQNTTATGYTGVDFYNESGTHSLTLAHSNSSAGVLASSSWLGTRNAEPLHFVTNGATPRMTIGADGNVGIGTIDPVSNLHIVGNALISINSETDTSDLEARTLLLGPRPDEFPASGLGLQVDAENKATIEYNTWEALGTGEGVFGFAVYNDGWPNGDPSWYNMVIAKNGNVGIATDAPDARLDVNGNAIVRGNMEITGSVTIQPQGDILMGEFGGEE